MAIKGKILFSFVVLLPLVVFLSQKAEAGSTMKLSSPSFKEQTMLPRKFTCQGEDVNPALLVEGIPEGTKSLVLIVDDPDAPMGTWLHWLVYDVPPFPNIAENRVPGKRGINDFGKLDYGGPCPPSGTHRYFFKVYALDVLLNLPEGKDERAVQKAMQGHVLGQAELVGLYKKQ